MQLYRTDAPSDSRKKSARKYLHFQVVCGKSHRFGTKISMSWPPLLLRFGVINMLRATIVCCKNHDIAAKSSKNWAEFLLEFDLFIWNTCKIGPHKLRILYSKSLNIYVQFWVGSYRSEVLSPAESWYTGVSVNCFLPAEKLSHQDCLMENFGSSNFGNFGVGCSSTFLNFAVWNSRESPGKEFFSAGRKQRLDIAPHPAWCKKSKLLFNYKVGSPRIFCSRNVLNFIGEIDLLISP